MRKIGFRGKSILLKEFVYGFILQYEAGTFITDGMILSQIDPETAGQFTGLTDKNGKEIFEGDIVKTGYCCYKVCFENGCFRFVVDETDMFYYITFDVETAKEVEVIGNIYDNPELLWGAE